jgi:hypothetical protein
VTKASDNIFPKVTFVEGSAPSSPSASDFHLYVDSSDHLLKYKNSAGTVTTLGAGFANPMTTAGDIIYGGASGVATRLAGGTSTYVLTSNGATSAPSWQAPSGGGALDLLEQHTASTSATLDFTTAISATYDEYQIEFVNVIPASNNVALYMRMSTNGGSSYDTSSIYDFTAGYAYSGGVGVGASATNSDRITLIDAVGNSSNYGVRGSIRLFSPGSTALYKSVLGQLMRDDASALGIVLITGVGGVYKSATAVNALRFLYSSGNIASGTIRVYGVAK